MPSNQGHDGEGFIQIVSKNCLRYVVWADFAVTLDIGFGCGKAIIHARLGKLLSRDSVDCFMSSSALVSSPKIT